MYDVGTCCSLRASRMLACVTLSNTFLKSTAAIHIGTCHSSETSRKIVAVNRWSVVPRRGRKPAWSELCWQSSASPNRLHSNFEHSL
eukprot:1158001-Pyramimonas_sp.AAC.1